MPADELWLATPVFLFVGAVRSASNKLTHSTSTAKENELQKWNLSYGKVDSQRLLQRRKPNFLQNKNVRRSIEKNKKNQLQKFGETRQ